jgi:WD40 repeat protein
MSQPTDTGHPPIAASDHDQPTAIDVRAKQALSAAEDAHIVEGAPPPAAGLAPLSRIGDHELLREVGRGGMGVVFQARHTRLGRIVALKMILGGPFAATEDLHRFETEVAAAARLQHPGIVALYEIGTHAQQPYFSMEFISGSSLAQRLALGPMANRRSAAYMEAVARAVHHAHQREIIHRDLKPANILLDDHDQPKVTDFGLAKLMMTDSGQTRTGAVLGTPSYMAPEQAAGQRAVTPACDIWSLGAILYELLTGRPPFRGETAMATLQQVADKDPVPPRLYDPAINPQLETICLKCLEKEPARRYATAEALADDLRRYLDEEPIHARRASALERTWKWCQRQPVLAALSAFTVIAVGGLMVFLLMAEVEERRLRAEAEQAESLAKVRAEAMRHLLYLAEMLRAQQALEQADFDRVQRLLTHWAPQGAQRDLRDWEWHFLHAHSQPPHTLHAHSYQASAIVWRPDGKQFASAGGEPSKPGEIKLWDASTGKLLATLQGHKLAITSLAWHPHQNLLASGSFDKTVKFWDTSAHRELITLAGHTSDVRSVAFDHKGDRLASGGRDKTIRLWKVAQALAGKAEAIALSGHDGDVTAVAFAPGDDLLASGSVDKTVRLWSLATLKTMHTLAGYDGPVECLAFSAGGALLAGGGGKGLGRGEIRIWSPSTGQLIASHFGLSDLIKSLSINATGVLAAGGNDGLVRTWDQAQSSECRVFRADRHILEIAFGPDGHTLAVAGASGRVSLFNSSGSLDSLRLSAPRAAHAVAFHPTEKSLAAGGANGSLLVWSLDQPQEPSAFDGHAATVTSVAFAPAGTSLASGDEDGNILLHDFPQRNQPPTKLSGHGATIRALVFAPDGSFLASASDDDTVRLWDAKGATMRRLLQHANGVRALAVSPNSHWLAAGGADKTIYLWDVHTGTATKLTGHGGTINTLAFSPDGQQLISGSSDKTIRLWSMETRAELPGPEASAAPVLALAYHPGSGRFASLSQDKMIRVWDVITRQEILELDDPSGNPRALAFSRDGRWLAAASGAAVRVWDSGRSITEK